jgi:ribose transport system substrate-binding protein
MRHVEGLSGRRVRTRVAAALALAAVLSAACGGGAAGAGAQKPRTAAGTVDLRGKKFAFALATAANPLIVQQGQLFKQQAQKLGASVSIYDNAGTAEAMLSNADLMVTAKPDVIVEYPSVADATSRVSQIFKRSGIPCISVNVPVEVQLRPALPGRTGR